MTIAGRDLSLVLRVAVALSVLLFVTRAAGEPMDAAASALDARAMNAEFSGANFRAAKKTLEKAVQTCGGGCSVSVQGRVHRDLAVVLITGFDDLGNGESEFLAALTVDPSLELDPGFSTPAVNAVFARVRAQVPRVAPPSASGGAARLVPAEEQRLHVPVPVYVEFPEGQAKKLKGKVHYRMVGEAHWHAFTLERVSHGFGVNLPCDAAPKAGTLEYYVDFKDEDGEQVLSVGSRDEPFHTDITRDAVDAPPHLPHRPPPEACTAPVARCTADADCHGDVCADGVCRPPAKPSPFGLGLSLAQDAPIISGTEVCTRDSQLNSGFSCFRASGSQYHGAPLRGREDKFGGGFVLATTRLVFGLDYVLSRSLSLGARIGYTLRGASPQSDGGPPALPILGEARLAYWFSGTDGEHLSPFITVASGVAQVDASRDVIVFEDRSVAPPPNQIDNPNVQKLAAWKKTGLVFVGFGGGIFVPFTRRSGLNAELRGLVLFPDSGFDVQMLLGYGVRL